MSTQTAGAGIVIPAWTFGDRLRRIRRELGVTQSEFAASIGQGDKAVAAWESGRTEPRDVVAIAKRIQMAHRVPATWTLGLNDETPRPGDGPDGGNAVCAHRDSNPEPAGSKSPQVNGSVITFPERFAVGDDDLAAAC